MTFSVSVSLPLPFIRSYRIEFYFSVPAIRMRLELRPLFLRGKLGALPPGSAMLLPCTCPSSNGRYGHGFYGNGYRYGNGYVTVEISHL